MVICSSRGAVGNIVLFPITSGNRNHGRWGVFCTCFFGVLIFVALMFMFVRFVHYNIPDKQDIPWLKGNVALKGNEHSVRVGKYNAAEDDVLDHHDMIFVLLVTGVIIWRPYFAGIFPDAGDSL